MIWQRRLLQLPVPRAARFAMVGGSGVIVNSGMLWLLHAEGGFPLAAASVLAIETAIWSNFFLNDFWTFHEERRRRPLWARAGSFHVTAFAVAPLNLLLLLTLVTSAGVHYLLANLIAVSVASVLNYGANALWTWRPLAPEPRTVSDRRPATGKRIVVVPTYNEAQNVGALINAVLAQGPEYGVLIVDDGSPDGTGDLVARRAAEEPRVHLLQRGKKLGLGTAYVDGFRSALQMGADLILQMDCDLSHDPADLPRLAEATAAADVVVGSRYVAGGRTLGWPWYRYLVSQGTSVVYRAVLGIPLHDITGGLKCWRREVLEELPLDEVRSRGFAFQMEMAYLCWRAGYTLVEEPVTFVERRRGRSKMSLMITLEAAVLLWRLSLGTPSPRPRSAS